MAEGSPQEQLAEQMAKLTRVMERRNSFWRALFLGIVRGVGMVVGATIIAAIALTMFWKFVQGIGIESVLQSLGIEVPEIPAQIPAQISPELLERYRQK